MYNIIPLVLILASLSVIAVIVVRKFSVLAALDMDTIQAEREAKFKEQIISKRLKRNIYKYSSRITRMIKPAGKKLGDFFSWLYKKLIEFKDNYNKEEEVTREGEKILPKLLQEAEDLVKEEKYLEAEKKYIEAIGIDSKNIKAFRKLGQLYLVMKNISEAKQTFLHAAKLIETDEEFLLLNEKEGDKTEKIINYELDLAGIYFDLALMSQEAEDATNAFKYIDRALAVEPNNPRYLDTKLEISIMLEDKPTALEVYDKLKEVNPENNKLPGFKAKIKEL